MHRPDLAAQVSERLRQAGFVAASLEAADLVSAAADVETLRSWVQRRERGEPLAWITGRAVFLGQNLAVSSGVYVPRAHSEQLAERAAALLPDGGRAADLCTGSGAVARHLRIVRPTATVIGTDIDRRAVECARRNGVPAVVADLDLGLRTRAFDVVTAVTPFVPTAELRLLPPDVLRYEPSAALDGGADGLDLVRRVLAAAARLLHPTGWLLTQLGGDQAAIVAPLLDACGFDSVTWWHDEDGDLRGVAARLAESVVS